MIHRIYSDLPSFKNLELHPGLNVLLADRERTSDERQTRNRAGKSSLVQVIDFVMGGSDSVKSIFRTEALEKWKFGLDFDLPTQRIQAERSGESFTRIVVSNADPYLWPIQPNSLQKMPNSFSQNDWCSLLGELFFGLPYQSYSKREKLVPTFRSLFSYFARSESEGGFVAPETQNYNQQPGDYQLALSFLLGLDWKIAQELDLVRKRERSLRELKRVAGEGALGSIISTSAQLRTELIVAEQASQRVHDILSRFEVLPEYHELEQEASDITFQINTLNNQNVIDIQLIESVRRSLEAEKPPVISDLIRLYSEVGFVLPASVISRFEDVEIFHNTVLANRKEYLSGELEAARTRMNNAEAKIKLLDSRRAQIMRLLHSRGALDEFQELQREASRKDTQLESIRQRFQAAEQLEGAKTELAIDRARLLQRLRLDLTEQVEKVNLAITTFESISHSLYLDAGSLSLDPTENGLKIDIHIQGQCSKGIKNMQIFCFDIMLMTLAAQTSSGLGFLVHDSHIFDGVDKRQVASALKLGSEASQRCGWQYLVTMNSDDVPATFPEGFQFYDHVLPVRLTDARDDGGLFGFRF